MRKLLLGLIGLLFAMPAVATDLPAGYTELEYIESTGTQYIDTGIKQQDGDEFGLVYQQITLDASYRNLFGAAVSGQMNEFYISQTSTTTYVGNDSDSNIPHDTNKHTLSWVTTSSSSQNIVVDGQTYVVSVRITPNPDLNVMVFARNASNGKMIGKVYGYYQKRNGEYLINFVPAKNSSGVVGMYDTVSGTFFTNAGTGEFIAGPEVGIRIATTAYNSARFSPVVTELNDTIATIRSVVTNTINQTKAIADLQATKQTRPDETCPAGKKCLLVEDNDGQPHWYEIIENAYGLPNGYTALEYIENTDSQYINTGITVNSGTTVIATFQGTDDDKGAVFGYDQDYTGTMMQCYNGKWRVNNTTTDLPCTTKATVDITWTDDTSGRHVSTATINGITVPAYTNSRTYKTLMLFQGNGWDSVNNYWTGGKIYSLSITQNNTLVRNFVPARNSSGVIGMYDTVSGTFFTNAGTGTFVEGPAVQ